MRVGDLTAAVNAKDIAVTQRHVVLQKAHLRRTKLETLPEQA
jgi:hypothetical protein